VEEKDRDEIERFARSLWSDHSNGARAATGVWEDLDLAVKESWRRMARAVLARSPAAREE
jgi:hypothetical protein